MPVGVVWPAGRSTAVGRELAPRRPEAAHAADGYSGSFRVRTRFRRRGARLVTVSEAPDTVLRIVDDTAMLLVGLDADQYQAVTSDAAPLAVLAGAGAGKTSVLTRRIAWRVRTERAHATRVLAVTFTRKAAGELAQRLRGLGVEGLTTGTFHATAFAQLRQWSDDHNRPPPRLLERKTKVLTPLLGEGSNQELTRRGAAIASEIEWAKARLISPDRYETAAIGAHRKPGLPYAQVAEVFALYERDRKKKRLLDYDDLINTCTRLIHDDPEFAAVQRWRFRHLFVDEFQDVTPAQLALVRAWLGERCDLCVVGDPDQAIYAFAGSDPNLLRTFETSFPGATSIRLRANHRSTAPILAAAHAMLGPVEEQSDVVLPRQSADAPAPTITRYASDQDEAAGIVLGVQRASRTGTPLSEIAILVRTNAQIPILERACIDAGVPVRVRSALSFLSSDHTRAVFDILDDLARAAPGRTFAEHLTDLIELADTGTPEERDVATPLVDLAREYLNNEGGRGSVNGFRTFTSAALRRDSEQGPSSAIDIATFHRAKGLEWNVVFVAGVEDGYLPNTHARHPAAIEEERRLAYVACTRARTTLHLSWAETRAFGYQVQARNPSPWLGAVGDATGAGTREEADLEAVAPIDHIESMRDGLGGPNGHLVRRRRHALLEWRSRHARALGVVPSVIVADPVITTLAQAAPDARAGLVAAGLSPDEAERLGATILEVLASANGPGGHRTDTVEG